MTDEPTQKRARRTNSRPDDEYLPTNAFTQTVKLVARDPNGKELMRTEVRGDHEHRFVHQTATTRSKRKSLQIAWDEFGREFNTLDCKVCRKNDWKVASRIDPTTMFDIELVGPKLWRITCKNCRSVWMSGGGTGASSGAD